MRGRLGLQFRLMTAVVLSLPLNAVMAGEVQELLGQATQAQTAEAYWHLAAGPQWTAPRIEALKNLVAQPSPPWLARAWLARLSSPAGQGLSDRMQALMNAAGHADVTRLDATLVGIHTWASDAADTAMRKAVWEERLTAVDRLSIALEAISHPRQPVSAVARCHLAHAVVRYAPLGPPRYVKYWYKATEGLELTEAELITAGDIRVACLEDAPPELGLPLAGVDRDKAGMRWLESCAQGSGFEAACAGLYRAAQVRTVHGLADRLLMDGAWFDAWIQRIDRPTAAALAVVLCPDRTRIGKGQRGFGLGAGSAARVDAMAMAVLLRHHADWVDPAIVARYDAQIVQSCVQALEVLQSPDAIEPEGVPSTVVATSFLDLLAAPMPATIDQLLALKLRESSAEVFRDRMAGFLRSRSGRYPTAVEVQRCEEFLYPAWKPSEE